MGINTTMGRSRFVVAEKSLENVEAINYLLTCFEMRCKIPKKTIE